MLERFTGLVIPHSQGAIVPTREQHTFLVDAQGVDHGLVAREVEYEGTFGTLPFFDAASVGVKSAVEYRSSSECNPLVTTRTSTSESVLMRCYCQRSHTLFVMS